MRIIKQSSTPTIMVLMTSSTNHIDGVTGLTLSGYISKNGNTFITTSLVVTEVGFGWYSIVLTNTDTDTLGDLVLHIEAIGADPSDIVMNITEYDINKMIKDMYTIQGLSSTPSTANKLLGKWIAGDIELDMSGDGVTSQTIQRH